MLSENFEINYALKIENHTLMSLLMYMNFEIV
jgi:hypothetical protein